MPRWNALPQVLQGYTIDRHKHSRFFTVRDARDEMVCVCVYRKGAYEVVRRLSQRETEATETRR